MTKTESKDKAENNVIKNGHKSKKFERDLLVRINCQLEKRTCEQETLIEVLKTKYLTTNSINQLMSGNQKSLSLHGKSRQTTSKQYLMGLQPNGLSCKTGHILIKQKNWTINVHLSPVNKLKSDQK